MFFGVMWPSDRLARQRELFAGQWREGIHQDGRMYFFNTATRETQWEVPDKLYDRYAHAICTCTCTPMHTYLFAHTGMHAQIGMGPDDDAAWCHVAGVSLADFH